MDCVIYIPVIKFYGVNREELGNWTFPVSYILTPGSPINKWTFVSNNYNSAATADIFINEFIKYLNVKTACLPFVKNDAGEFINVDSIVRLNVTYDENTSRKVYLKDVTFDDTNKCFVKYRSYSFNPII